MIFSFCLPWVITLPTNVAIDSSKCAFYSTREHANFIGRKVLSHTVLFSSHAVVTDLSI